MVIKLFKNIFAYVEKSLHNSFPPGVGVIVIKQNFAMETTYTHRHYHNFLNFIIITSNDDLNQVQPFRSNHLLG